MILECIRLKEICEKNSSSLFLHLGAWKWKKKKLLGRGHESMDIFSLESTAVAAYWGFSCWGCLAFLYTFKYWKELFIFHGQQGKHSSCNWVFFTESPNIISDCRAFKWLVCQIPLTLRSHWKCYVIILAYVMWSNSDCRLVGLNPEPKTWWLS